MLVLKTRCRLSIICTNCSILIKIILLSNQDLVYSAFTQEWKIGEDLKAPPVSHDKCLNAKDGLSQGEWYLDGNSYQHGELEPDMLHGQHKADHKAANAAHSSDDSQYSVAHPSPGSSTESSKIVDDL